MQQRNPLFPDQNSKSTPVVGQFDVPEVGGQRKTAGSNSAADLIRAKLNKLYASEPKAKDELAEAVVAKPRSKHQQFMYDLSTSGKSLADIQTAWHGYYVALPDHEKHEVWQEFYDTSANSSMAAQPGAQQFGQMPAWQKPQPRTDIQKSEATAVRHASQPVSSAGRKIRTSTDIRTSLINRVADGNKRLAHRQGVRSLIFGLSMGFAVLAILLLGFFNEVVIAPFIQPSRSAAATPIIFNGDTVAATDDPQVIVPKINVQIPVDYTLKTNNEDTVQAALNDAVIHYPSTSKPGDQGNVAVFGHSSNNIFNKGKYKFAFVLLSHMENGDVFYLTYGGKVYAYKVFDKKVVKPNDTWVLKPVDGKPATATLITCDPPGTSINRLVVWGEQISPDPAANIAAAPQASQPTQPAKITSNGPTLLGRVWNAVNPF